MIDDDVIGVSVLKYPPDDEKDERNPSLTRILIVRSTDNVPFVSILVFQLLI